MILLPKCQSGTNLVQIGHKSVMLVPQELEIAEKEGRRLRREGESKKEKVKEEEEAGPSGAALDGDGPTPMETQMSGLDERLACPQALALSHCFDLTNAMHSSHGCMPCACPHTCYRLGLYELEEHWLPRRLTRQLVMAAGGGLSNAC